MCKGGGRSERKNFSTVSAVKTKLAIRLLKSSEMVRYAVVGLVESWSVLVRTIQSRIGYVPNVLPVIPY